MYVCYLDESGDPGPNAGSPTPRYTVAAVLVEGTKWRDGLDDLVRFRRYLNREFGIPVRAEIKATDLTRGRGPIKKAGLGVGARLRIYRGFMRLEAKSSMKTFAVSVDKSQGFSSPGEVFDSAWRHTFERLERFCHYNSGPLMIVVDASGAYPFVRKLARKMRRHNVVGSTFGTGTLSRPLEPLIDDPIPRHSHESYFIQLADLNAYAAYRRIVPTQGFPQEMWEELGDGIERNANKYSGGPPGIVVNVPRP